MPDRIQTLLQFLEDDPDDAFTRFALAQEYQKQGDAEAALGYYEGLVRDQPGYVGTYYHLAGLYAALGRPDEAVATYERGIEVATEAGDTHARAELQSALLEAQGFGFE